MRVFLGRHSRARVATRDRKLFIRYQRQWNTETADVLDYQARLFEE